LGGRPIAHFAKIGRVLHEEPRRDLAGAIEELCQLRAKLQRRWREQGLPPLSAAEIKELISAGRRV